jgi:dihydroxyacetone kinase-like predicted kinase
MVLPEQTIEFRYDTQLLIEGEDLDEDEISDYITENFEGDSLIAAGDDVLIKIHFHTNEPWLVLEYGQSIGDIYDAVVENMQRQEEGLQG